MSKATGLNGLRLTVQAIMQMLRKKADKDKVVSSVNGTGPDENGNVELQVGVTSWNDLQGKPFGEEKVVDIAWDGVIGDRPKLAMSYSNNDPSQMTMGLVKVAEAFSPEFLVDGTVRLHTSDPGQEDSNFALSSTQILSSDGLTFVADAGGQVIMCAIAHEDGLQYGGMTFPEAGTYFFYSSPGGGYVSYTDALVCFDVEQLDPKYIPISCGALVGVIDKASYNVRILNPSRGASAAQLIEAAYATKTPSMHLMIEYDNQTGFLSYVGKATNTATGVEELIFMGHVVEQGRSVLVNNPDNADLALICYYMPVEIDGSADGFGPGLFRSEHIRAESNMLFWSDSNGKKYMLTVGTDGTLSTVAV